MDFDEYDYLEKTVENPELLKEDAGNGVGEEAVKSKEKERSRSSRHRSGDKDKDKDKDRSRRSGEESRGSKERSRHRSRSRERSGRRSKDGEEKNGKEGEKRERDRGGDKDADGKDRERSRRSHSRSRSEKHRSDAVEREKSRDREIRDRDKESNINRRYKDKKDDGGEPDADPERDQRTVFAYQICLKADERDVYEFFSRAGKVRDVRLIMDRNSRRSKGVGYIEFYDVMSVPMAIALSGQLLLGLPVMVKPSEAEKNLVQSTTAVVGPGGQIGPYSGGARRLYVGNLHTNIKEEDLRQVFGAFGPVELVQLPVDETGSSKGFGFVQFARLEDARNSLSLNGQIDIGGRTIKVSAVTDQVPDAGGNTGDFDDDEGGGLALNARSRALLMQKLDRTGTATNITGSLVAPAISSNGLPLPPGTIPAMSSMGSAFPALSGLQVAASTGIDSIGVPSECLQLNNMFDPASEMDPDFDLDIKEDVQEECSKFGDLKHIYVDKNSAGVVYLRFGSTQSAMGAQRSLHGRWFAGKMITASYMLPQIYEAKFPESSI